jgi:RNA polymerase sigma-70 factor, ECF subfamily
MTTIAAMEAVGYEESSNVALIDRCRMNDPDACNELLSRFNARIFNMAYRILGEESSAEDALQETLLNVYRGLRTFRGQSKVSTWISRITINVCLGMLRKNKGRQHVALDDALIRDMPSDTSACTDPLEHASRAELLEIIEDAFSKMAPRQRIVVRLHDIEGYTIHQIARVVCCPVGTIKSRLFYGRLEFKNIFTALLNARCRNTSIH